MKRAVSDFSLACIYVVVGFCDSLCEEFANVVHKSNEHSNRLPPKSKFYKGPNAE